MHWQWLFLRQNSSINHHTEKQNENKKVNIWKVLLKTYLKIEEYLTIYDWKLFEMNIIQNTQEYSQRLSLLHARWKRIHEIFLSEHARSYGVYLIWANLYAINLLRIFNFFYENY